MRIPNTKLALTLQEKASLRKSKIKLQEIATYAVDELMLLLKISKVRAREIRALAEFQRIPSVGVKFAHDLLSLGYYSLEELKDKTGPQLIQELELSVGAWIDPCVEDQCRLAVHYANHPGSKKSWWDFTTERKQYRALHGYPANRPKKAWHQLDQYAKGQ